MKLKKILQALIGNPADAALDKFKRAARRVANCNVELEYQEMMCNFYAEQSASINPHTHWWEFAESQEAFKGHTEEVAFLRHRQQSEAAKMHAALSRYKAYQAQGESQ